MPKRALREETGVGVGGVQVAVGVAVGSRVDVAVGPRVDVAVGSRVEVTVGPRVAVGPRVDVAADSRVDVAVGAATRAVADPAEDVSVGTRPLAGKCLPNNTPPPSNSTTARTPAMTHTQTGGGAGGTGVPAWRRAATNACASG